ncbi:glycosyltransferase family 2 protein [Candidatus Uhrbacteria bacterium]|nr:glycosyltransferase family 2 protein [Candidatus Uhrbacteria bacterium]MBT7717575.1 glycosyltransferase family 2 protein [Candidatus Uhrbacteria bacterium]
MSRPKVAIIYLCHNDLRYVPEVVESWHDQTYQKDRLATLMIPNGATDGVQDLIKSDILPRSKKDLPEMVMIDDGVNHGFAGGNNLGIKWAIDHGFDYVFLNNGDLKLDPKAIEKLVEVMESDSGIGSAQSFVRFWKEPEMVNVTGGVMHVAGFGYARDNGSNISDVKRKNGEEIMYASGAAVMYRLSALKKVGFLEEGFFMYHEDLELGLRLRFAGYKNVLCTESHAFHDYSFGRNPKKFQWMETYRYIVLFSYAKFRSLLLLVPMLKFVECGMWAMSLKGGWLGSKLKANIELCKPSTLGLLWKMRQRAQSLRTIDDKDWMKMLSPKIEAQEVESEITTIGNSIISWMWKIILPLIRW